MPDYQLDEVQEDLRVLLMQTNTVLAKHSSNPIVDKYISKARDNIVLAFRKYSVWKNMEDLQVNGYRLEVNE